ncbi:ABC transporter substrate-binding protein [Candidatus Epulonipiscium fishelsonii]|uniref:ABC transporter substrate-binding protein n=1 Tax=Candidatus Epulonipiscium fishelsonii TaxID=77094 RepID=A0ACC8XHI7_9FIRM|nr:ABC transporter substrate-binding protein [Epulopiscium sp. SCG-D08WGA-EpuloA1]
MLTACGGSSEEVATSIPVQKETEAPDTLVSEGEELAVDKEEIKLSPEGYPIADVQELTYNLGADPKTIDPQLNSAVDGGQIINNTFEGLIRDVNGEIRPGMAESWDISDDSLVYTFHLRDAVWSDGQPVTANDFVFAWKRAADPKTASEYAYILESANIKNSGAITRMENIVDPATGEERPATIDDLGVKAIDDKTFEVTLANPTEYFLSLTGFATFMPVREDVVDADGIWAKDPTKAISNGPFMLTDYAMGDQIVLEKNPNYWNAENVTLEKIVCKMIVDSSTAFTAYNSDQLDLLESVPTAEVPKLIAENPEFYVLPYIGTYFYVLNLNNEVLQDINVRKALNFGLDRKIIAEQVAGAGQIPATGFVGPGFLDTEGNEFNEVTGDYGIPITADVEAAQKALADAGYPGGEGFPEIEIMYNTNEGNKLLAEAVQEMWATNLGIDVKLTNQEWAVFQETRNNQTYDSVARHGWIGDYTDPNTMLEIFITGNPQNNGAYSNPEFDEQMALAKTTIGKERMDHLYEASDILMSDMPVIPVYYYVNTLLAIDEIEGWSKNSQGKLWLGDAMMLDFDKM